MATLDDETDVTGLLLKWRDGDKGALDALVPLVYRRFQDCQA